MCTYEAFIHVYTACRRHFSKGSAAGCSASERLLQGGHGQVLFHRTCALCMQTPAASAAKIHVACKGGMPRSSKAPVSPHVLGVQSLAAKIHAVYIHIYIYIYICMYAFVCIAIFICVCIHIYIIYIYTQICMYLLVYICTCICMLEFRRGLGFDRLRPLPEGGRVQAAGAPRGSQRPQLW